MKRGDIDAANELVYREFCVCQAAIQQWLTFLSNHHPIFQQQVQIDHDALIQLPEDAFVHDEAVRALSVQELDDDLF